MKNGYTLLAKGERAAIIGDAAGNITIATAEAVEGAREGFFAKALPAYGTEVIVPHVARIENESIVIHEALTLRKFRYAAPGEVLECGCVFDELEKNWYVRENSCVAGKLL